MSSRYEEVLANQATWQKVEGVEVLRVKDSPIVAVPTNGRRNSARFQVIDLASREELCWLAQGGSLVAFGGPDRRCTVGEFEETLSAVLSTDDKVLLEALYRSGYQNYGWE